MIITKALMGTEGSAGELLPMQQFISTDALSSFKKWPTQPIKTNSNYLGEKWQVLNSGTFYNLLSWREKDKNNSVVKLQVLHPFFCQKKIYIQIRERNWKKWYAVIQGQHPQLLRPHSGCSVSQQPRQSAGFIFSTAWIRVRCCEREAPTNASAHCYTFITLLSLYACKCITKVSVLKTLCTLNYISC